MTKTSRIRLSMAILGLAFLALAFGGCASGPQSDGGSATATAPIRPTDSPLPPSATPAPTATATASPSPTATATASPTPTPTQPPIYGAEMNRISPERGLDLARPAGLYWLRYKGQRWANVEASWGTYDWAQVSDVEAQLQAAFQAGLKTILIVRHTPEWAQTVPGSFCSAPRPEALQDLAAFLAEAVERYKDPPYGVKYWELGNEPDVDPMLVPPDSGFGCWGDEQDPYYGGEYYGQMLQVVYPAIKAADPEAQVLIGGLLLDRDPTVDEHTNPPAHFLEGILRGGGGDFFDIVSFHSYVSYDGQLHDWQTIPPTWAQRGGTLAGKVDFLREVLAKYGYDKPLMLTETGILCRKCPSPAPEDFLLAQAAYLPRLYTQSMALELQAVIWYTLNGPGWRETGLLDADQQPRPAYEALMALTTRLANVDYLGPLEQFPGLEGYAFRRRDGQGEVWVLWAPEDSEVSIELPPGLQQAYDLGGQPLSLPDGSLSVGFAPVYLEVSP
jgi:hypothetical protein